MVDDIDLGVRVHRLQRHLHRASRRRVHECVANKIRDCLTEAKVVTGHDHRGADARDHVAFRVGRARIADRVVDHRREVDGRAVERPPLIEPREQQQVVDEQSHAPCLVLDAPHREQHVLARHVGIALQQLRVAAHRRQRRAQLVRRVGDEMAETLLHRLALGEGALDLTEHLVECQTEAADLRLLG